MLANEVNYTRNYAAVLATCVGFIVEEEDVVAILINHLIHA